MDQMLNEIVASDETITGAAKDVLHKCVVKFITRIATEANAIAQGAGKTQIGGEHIIQALKDLGVEDLVEKVSDVGQQFPAREKGLRYTSRNGE
jgi:histone H3/H4